MNRHLWILTGLSLAVTGVTARPAASAPPPLTSEEADALAKRLFREQQYPAAAAEFERLWTERSVPKHLFNAAMAREMMGHELQAFVHLHTFLAVPGLPEAEIVKAQDRIRALKERTIRLRVRVSPADLPAGTLALDARRRDGSEPSPSVSEVRLEPATLETLAVPGAPGAYDLPLEVGQWDLEFAGRGYAPGRASVQAAPGPAYPVVVQLERISDTVDVTTEFMPAAAVTAGVEVVLKGPAPATRQRVERSPVTWRLRPGAWTLEASAPGYEATRKDFTAGTEPVRLQVQLAQKRQDGRRLALGLGVAGGVMVVTGAVVLGVAGGKWMDSGEEVLRKADAIAKPGSEKAANQIKLDEWGPATTDMRKDWDSMNVGAGLMGAGLGLWIGSVTALTPRPRRAWIAEIAVGTATGAGGILIHSFVVVKNFAEHRRTLFNGARTSGTAYETVRKNSISDFNGDHRSGLGLGLLIGAGAGLVIGGVTGLLQDRPFVRRRSITRVTPYYDARISGLSLTAAF